MKISIENKYGQYKYCCATKVSSLKNVAVYTRCYDKDKTKYVMLTPEIKQQYLDDIEASGLHLINDDYIGEIVSRIDGRTNYKITYRRYGLIQNISNDTNTLRKKEL